ncbi:MAG: hypothetical protein AAGK92_02730 [Pseudomonadota bacterium]
MMTRRLCLTLLASLVAGCGAVPPTQHNDPKGLAPAIAALGPGVDPDEARRAAQIAQSYALQLAAEYQITDPPLIHNYKVHRGEKARGICNHFTEDILARLRQERFQTLSLHWATSPTTLMNPVHHAPAISAKGAPVEDGIILDGWRDGGRLYWSPVAEDPTYDWQDLNDVQELLQARRARTR